MGYGKEITIKMVNKKYKDSYAIENLIKYTVTDKKRKKDCRYRGGHGAYYMYAKKAAEQFMSDNSKAALKEVEATQEYLDRFQYQQTVE